MPRISGVIWSHRLTVRTVDFQSINRVSTTRGTANTWLPLKDSWVNTFTYLIYLCNRTVMVIYISSYSNQWDLMSVSGDKQQAGTRIAVGIGNHTLYLCSDLFLFSLFHSHGCPNPWGYGGFLFTVQKNYALRELRHSRICSQQLNTSWSSCRLWERWQSIYKRTMKEPK